MGRVELDKLYSAITGLKSLELNRASISEIKPSSRRSMARRYTSAYTTANCKT